MLLQGWAGYNRPMTKASKAKANKKTSAACLDERLGELWPRLTQGDPGAVHEARKLTRKVAAEQAVTGAPKKVRHAWRDLRRAVAPLRDHDVAGEHLAAALKEQGRPQSEITAFRRDWAAQREQLLTQVQWPEQPPTLERPSKFGRRARRALAHEAQDLLEDTPAVLRARKADIWHEWRKSLKHYRYTLELVGKSPQSLSEILDALGRMQDAEVVRGLLEQQNLLPDQREALLAREKKARTDAQHKVRTLWPELEAHLREMAEQD